MVADAPNQERKPVVLWHESPLGLMPVQGWSIPWSPLRPMKPMSALPKNCCTANSKPSTPTQATRGLTSSTQKGPGLADRHQTRPRLKKMAEGEQKDKLRAEESAKARIRASLWSIRFTRSNASLAIPRLGSRGWQQNTIPGGAHCLLGQPAQLVRKKLMAIKERQEYSSRQRCA